jgi:integrase
VDFERMTIDLAWQLQQLPQRHGCGAADVDGAWPCGRKKSAYCPEREFDVDPGDVVKVCHRGVGWVRPKTTAGKRLVPIIDRLARKLQEHQVATADQPNPHNLVWHHRDGRPVYHKDDHEAWQALLVGAGVREAVGPTIDQHRTRNTTLTMLLDAGVDTHIINAAVGHSDVAMTRGYQRVDLTLARQAFEKLPELP